tara:strand:- start:2319 stop:2726 length:408 start_codon:yes stop_codon:yes gene_type:complete
MDDFFEYHVPVSAHKRDQPSMVLRLDLYNKWYWVVRSGGLNELRASKGGFDTKSEARTNARELAEAILTCLKIRAKANSLAEDAPPVPKTAVRMVLEQGARERAELEGRPVGNVVSIAIQRAKHGKQEEDENEEG